MGMRDFNWEVSQSFKMVQCNVVYSGYDPDFLTELFLLCTSCSDCDFEHRYVFDISTCKSSTSLHFRVECRCSECFTALVELCQATERACDEANADQPTSTEEDADLAGGSDHD